MSVNTKKNRITDDCQTESSAVSNKMYKQIVNALMTLVNERDPYTAKHCQNVARLSCFIGNKIGCNIDTLRGLYVAGMLHDIGKTSVPSEILSKSGILTQGEWEILKSHPVTGYIITSKIDFPWPVSTIILQHHERLDGSGYPNGLYSDEIIKESKILAIADVIDAMLSHRPYRPALAIKDVIRELETNIGIKYDKEIAEVAIELIPNYTLGKLKDLNSDEMFAV